MADETPRPDPAETPADALPLDSPDLPDGKPEAEEDDAPDYGYELNTAQFYNIVHKQLIHVTTETLASAKLDWELVEPFLNAARDVCRGDFVRTARMEVHGVTGEPGALEEAEEAFLSLSVADQDNGALWFEETWWLSDLILQAGDPARIRESVAALERTTARLKEWLETAEGKNSDG